MVRQEPPKSLASPGPPAVSADEQSEALQCWLRTGFVLYRSCVGLDRFLAELSRDYHRMVLQQASSVRPDEQLACTCQVALYDPASSCDTCKRVADAIQSSGGPPDQRPALTWSNSDPTLWLDLRLGAWEVAKLYAGSMGPPFLARSTSPREADVGTKLTILRGLAKVTHALDPAVVAAVGEAHQRWLGKASREMSKAESSEVQQAMQGLIEAVHGVHEASQQYLIEALQATETISGSADLLRSYGPAVVEAVLTEPIKRIRVQRLEASGAAEAETAGLLERLTSASAGLGSVASAVVERVDRVLADRQQAAAKGSGGGGDKRPTSHLIGAEDDEDDEEEDSEAIAQLEKKFHGGVRPELQSTLASIRAAIEQRNSKEVLRLGLPLLLKAKDLLPVELHCTHEYLSWAYSAEKRMPQARAAIDKALQVPGIYCPLALRLKWRNLEIIEDANESAEESRALMMESLETLDLIKEEDELPSDRSRRVAISVNLCFLHFQQLRQLSREEESEETVTTMREICRESIERLTGTVEAFKQGQVRKEQQPFLWVSAQRLLGLFLTEASVKEPESGGGYLDRAIECYHEVIQTVIYHRFVRGLVNQETQQLATYRLELARIHLQRRRGEEDEQAALALFDACFETAQEAGEIINTLRYRAEFLNERGDKNNDEGDLRAAINDYQQALEVLQNHRELREKHQVEIAHFQRAMGLIYMGIVNMKMQQHEQSKEGGGEENGSGGAGADQEKAINHLLAAHDVFRKQDEGILDAGMTALQLGDLFRHRTRDRKKRNQERAIEWYTKANQMMREGTKGNSASRGLVEMLVRVADSLSKMYEERVNGDKADNAKHAMQWRIKAAELSSLLAQAAANEAPAEEGVKEEEGAKQNKGGSPPDKQKVDSA